MSRSLRATAVAAPLFCLATVAEWGGLVSAAWPGDLTRYVVIADRTFAGGIPYHNFYDEYPPFALPAFLLPRAISERHYDLVFKLLMIGCWIVAIWTVARLLERLGASSARMTLALATMVLTPTLLGQVFLNRYDPYAAMLAVLALAALVEGRERLGAGWLAAGFEAKVFPIAAAPVVAVRIWRHRGKHGLVAPAVTFVAVCIAISGFFLVVAFGGVGYSYKSQLTRGLQLESMGASVLLAADKLGLYTAHAISAPPGEIDVGGSLANAVANVSFAVEIAAILAVVWAYRRAREDDELLVSAFAASIVAYTIFSKVLSPQYLTWLVPLVVVTRTRVATLLMLVLLPLTQAEVYWGKHGLPATPLPSISFNWSVWLLAARNLLLIAVYLVLLRSLWRERAPEPQLESSSPDLSPLSVPRRSGAPRSGEVVD